MKHAKECTIIFLIGGITYACIEILWRQYTHWSMVIAGGTSFLSLYKIYDKLKDISLLTRCVIGSGVITAIEFVTGCIVNLWLNLNVWNYSFIPFNILGQICILYSTLWGFLCIPINGMCHGIRKIKNAENKKAA